MAKKIQSTSKKKKVKSSNSTGDSLLEEINVKLKSSQKDLQKQVDELTAQVKTLSKDSGKTARKLLNTIEKSYHKKVSQLHKDFDRRMVGVHKFQEKIIAHLPKELAEKLSLKVSSTAKPAIKSSKTAKTPGVKVNKRPIAKPKSVPAVANVARTHSIISIKGIGPVIQKKLAEAGFTRLEDLANTPASKAESLKQFEKTRGFNTWKKDAQALLDKN